MTNKDIIQDWLNDKTMFLSKYLDRRLQTLFAVACCKDVWHLLTHPDLCIAVLATESYVENKISLTALKKAQKKAFKQANTLYEIGASAFCIAAAHAVCNAIYGVVEGKGNIYDHLAFRVAHTAQAATHAAVASAHASSSYAAFMELAKILISFLQPELTWNKNWTTNTTLSLAHHIYDGDWSLIPVLADALEEVDCPHTNTLREKPHHRGNWFLDNLLGKR